MSQCDIQVEQAEGGWRHTCSECGWSRVLRDRHDDLHRECRPDPTGEVMVVACVPVDKKYVRLPSGIRCYRNNVYSVPKSDLSAGGLTVVKNDGSAVGTRLRTMFSFLGFGDKPGCSCAAVRSFLDAVDMAYVKSHQGYVVELIRQSAAQVGINVPALAIHAALATAVLMESFKCHQNSTPD